MQLIGAVSEKGTAVFTFSWTDAQGDSVVPKTATYALFDEAGNSLKTGNIIDSRLVLSDEDLAFTENDTTVRILRVEATYDEVGKTDATLREEWKFKINALRTVT